MNWIGLDELEWSGFGKHSGQKIEINLNTGSVVEGKDQGWFWQKGEGNLSSRHIGRIIQSLQTMSKFAFYIERY